MKTGNKINIPGEMQIPPSSPVPGHETEGFAMILAAGLGTRLKPWTDHHPKALALVNGKSLLQRNVEYLQQYGIRNLVVNVHHFAEQIIEVIRTNNGWGSNISISDETDTVLETGGGLKKAAWYFKNVTDFVLMNADILTDLNMQNMLQQHKTNQALATLAVTNRETSRYLLFTPDNHLCGWKNIKTGEERPHPLPTLSSAVIRGGEGEPVLRAFAFSGIQIINTQFFSLMTREGKFSIIDVYLDLCSSQTILGYDHTGDRLIDAGKPESIQKAESLFSY
jgi:NDP-sugar pyrophosphorylase family protein